MLICPVFQRHSLLKKAYTQQGAAPANSMNYTMQINFILLSFSLGGSTTCRANFVISAVSNLLWKFFKKKSKKEACSGQQRVSQD